MCLLPLKVNFKSSLLQRPPQWHLVTTQISRKSFFSERLVSVCVSVMANRGYSFILWPRFEAELNRGHERHGPPSGAGVMCNPNGVAHRHSQPSRKQYYAYTRTCLQKIMHAHTCSRMYLYQKTGHLTWKFCRTHLPLLPWQALSSASTCTQNMSSNEGTCNAICVITDHFWHGSKTNMCIFTFTCIIRTCVLCIV